MTTTKDFLLKKYLIIALLLCYNISNAQKLKDFAAPVGIAALSFVVLNTDKKTIAKEISQFRSKEYIINYIIGPTAGKDIQFETESLASDDSAGLISVAFNCKGIDKQGLLLAFFGSNKDANGKIGTAYGFRYIPLKEAQNLLKRIDTLKDKHKSYLKNENDVNNVYIEYEDIKFILYRDGGDKVRVFWNGFEVIWERTAFDRTARRLDRWFD